MNRLIFIHDSYCTHEKRLPVVTTEMCGLFILYVHGVYITASLLALECHVWIYQHMMLVVRERQVTNRWYMVIVCCFFVE
jgi:hypothetical protein